MDTTESLGVVAHRGGLLVRRPELSIGVVQAVSRPSGLEIELIARRRRHTLPVAPRVLLPAFDEGYDLRLGWLGQDGTARWEYPTTWSGSSGTSGQTHRASFTLPPTFDRVSLVLAWPEIGFPEAVRTVPLPDRATVERETTSIWRARLDTAVPAGELDHHDAPFEDEVAVEEGTVVATPRVLHRGEHAVVVLTRLTAVGSLLAAEVLSIARGDRAEAVGAQAFRPWADQQGAAIAVVRGRDAFWFRSFGGSASGGDGVFSSVQEFTLRRPRGDVLDLVVAWQLAGLHDIRSSIPLDARPGG